MRALHPAFLVAALLACTTSARAWVFHEHREITESAVGQLAPDERRELDVLWEQLGREPARLLCADAVPRRTEHAEPSCIDFPMLPAIAADHSCSPAELLRFFDEDWMLRVARIGAETERAIAEADGERQIIDAWNGMHLDLERADRDYTTRAVANDGHFLLPRRTGDLDVYLREVLRRGQYVNAAMLYAVYHVAAIGAARAYARAPAGSPQAARLAADALLDEAFALHFLQDTFSAGHVVGAWGDKATKKGTHDLYSIHGFDAFTWDRQPYSAHGDAFLRPVDLQRSSHAVWKSLSTVLAAALGRGSSDGADAYATAELRALRNYDVCAAASVEVAVPPAAVSTYVVPVWTETPMPSSPEDATPPVRERAEIGPFVGFQSGGSFDAMFGGYQSPERGAPRSIFTLSAAIGIGYGLEGITPSAGDGRLFLMLGVDAQSAQYDLVCSGDCADERSSGSLVPRVPSRIGYQARLRMPFWLIPGDLVIAAPFLALISMEDLTKMGILATDGGLIPWQRVFPTAIGDFQFVVGREFAVTYFDMDGNDAFYAFGGEGAGGEPILNPVRVQSLQFQFPILEYRPFRAFHGKLVGSLAAQLGVGFETPVSVSSLNGGDADASVSGGFLGFLRVYTDGRAYW